MNIRSAKAKGMKLQKQIIEVILNHFSELTSNDIRSIPGSVPGADLWFSEKAREILGAFDIECKNQETLSIWTALQQVEDRCAKSKDVPLLVFHRNHSKTYCTLEFDTFLHILKLGVK